MLQGILDFFRRLFGGDDAPAESASELIEDAAALPNDHSTGEIVEGDPMWAEAEVATRGLDSTTARVATRGLDATTVDDSMTVGETVNVTTPAVLDAVRITKPRYLWCLDPGHGRLQPGKRSPVMADGRQFFEWEFTRDVIRRMRPRLDAAGVQYVVVVPEDDVSDFLRERVQRANAQTSPLGIPKIFVSIHANAAGDGVNWNPAEGIETFSLPGSATGKKIATVFHKHIVGALPKWRNRGLKEANFYVLTKTTMPSILTENGFYTQEQQTRELLEPAVRQRIADAHVAAILEIEQRGL